MISSKFDLMLELLCSFFKYPFRSYTNRKLNQKFFPYSAQLCFMLICEIQMILMSYKLYPMMHDAIYIIKHMVSLHPNSFFLNWVCMLLVDKQQIVEGRR
ncbi:hypothetical protein V6Z11_D08G117100 [Gossypium hirsutum]